MQQEEDGRVIKQPLSNQHEKAHLLLEYIYYEPFFFNLAKIIWRKMMFKQVQKIFFLKTFFLSIQLCCCLTSYVVKGRVPKTWVSWLLPWRNKAFVHFLPNYCQIIAKLLADSMIFQSKASRKSCKTLKNMPKIEENPCSTLALKSIFWLIAGTWISDFGYPTHH